ncbi:anti-sigma regulatory factor [Paractinoplanes tereljensis]|uniref:Anti-sigma regulatory factor n=1 Tax=Paractinoplanes tereljensis TaxID=571912 RepID=A0A919TSF4_9ACTN|nr:anti-sigma factor RsbA family regulatory protein [Actinoplanes tereljensis]GIF20194.1 anti-sigma regulatory factor [Actinoplanes tereljensis]
MTHRGLLYHDVAGFLSATVPFVRSAVENGDPVLVALPGHNLDLLRDALAGDRGRVDFADMTVTGRNPGRIIPGLLLRYAAEHPGKRVWFVGEPVWPGRSSVEYPACAAHEALVNTVFEGRDATFLCPYDASLLTSSAIADAWRTHPVMIDHGVRVPSPSFGDPVTTAGDFNIPLPPPPASATVLDYRRVPDLVRVRDLVRRQAGLVLTGDRLEEMILAAHELAANTIKHTTGPGRIAVWTEPGLFACQVDDTGHITDPLAGRVPPHPMLPSGRGLLLVNQICDLVRIHTGPSGTSIRTHLLT